MCKKEGTVIYNYNVISENRKTMFQDIKTNKVINIGDEVVVRYWTSNKISYKVVVDKIKNNIEPHDIYLFVK